MSLSNEPREAAAEQAGAPGTLATDDTLPTRDRRGRGATGGPLGVVVAGELLAGKYRLLGQLGEGGMAAVWRAEHVPLRRDVAVKLVLPGMLTDPRIAEGVLGRFQFEAQVSAQLCEKSPHVVAVYDYGTHRGLPFLVMELVSGGSLEREIERRGAIPPAEVADILEQVADALDTAHALGIVHRDLKPSNLLLATGKGGARFVKVADFGVAKAISGELRVDQPRLTVAGDLVGSPAFMSPEQIMGDHPVDGRSDVWAMGVVAYEALTGGNCFAGDTLMQVLASVTTRRYVKLSERRPTLPRSLDEWLSRALAPLPEGRPATVGQLAAELRASLAPRSRRRPVLIAAAALVVAAAVGIGATFFGGRASGDTGAPPAPAVTESATNVVPSSAAAAPDTSAAPSVEAPAPTSRPARPQPSSAPLSTGAISSSEPATTSSAPAPVAPSPAPTTPQRPPRKMDPSEIQ